MFMFDSIAMLAVCVLHPGWHNGRSRKLFILQSHRSKNGISLIEVLIVSALLGIVLGLAGEIAAASMHSFSKAEYGYRNFRSASSALAAVSTDLRDCQAVLWPQYTLSSWRRGRKVFCSEDGCFLFVFKTSGINPSYSGFYLDGKKKILYRLSYKGVPPAQYAQLVSAENIAVKRIIGRGITDISISSVNWRSRGGLSFLDVSITPAGDDTKRHTLGTVLVTQIRTRGG